MPTFELEAGLRRRGYPVVAGIDEAGRGPLAGPVVAAAVILPASHPEPEWFHLIDDSKRLTSSQRERSLQQIRSRATAIGVGSATAEEIDAEGIAEATRRAMVQAVEGLATRPGFLLIDYVALPHCGIPFHSMPHGESVSYSIAAASIVAKVTRDRLMIQADALYPEYGFCRHKGYGTRDHIRTLSQLGPCPIHRRSFNPLRAALDGEVAAGPTSIPQAKP